ncbi:MAG: TonB-dependent receptor [Flavobacteriales bacterium]|nr:TonB-dependent receptor [Flavobacteriales bacterium]
MKHILLYIVFTLSIIQTSFGSDIKLDPIKDKPKSGKIFGLVIDSQTKKGVEFASVSLLNIETSEIIAGELTNEKGFFDFLSIKKGEYMLKIDFIGYESFNSDVINIASKSKVHDLGKILLKPDVSILNDVTVSAERTYIENKIDKKVVNIGKDLLTAGASAVDIMSNLPSVDVDIEGNVSLRGSENVRILVDGRPTNLTSEELLASIPAENIDKVEIITNPSAKYDPDGISGILNIILKKNKKLGFNGSVNGGIGSANEFSGINKYNASLNLNYNTGKWNFFANYGYRDNQRVSSGDFTRETFDKDGVKTGVLEQESSKERGRKGHTLKAGVDYNFNESNNISYTANVRNSKRSAIEDMEYLQSTIPKRTTDSEYDSKSLSHDLTYKSTLNETSSLEFNVYRIDSKSDRKSVFEQENRGDENDSGKGNDNMTSTQVDYTMENDGSKLELGAKGQVRNIDSDYHFYDQYDDDLESRSNHFLFNEQLYSVYTNYGKKWGPWGLQAGIRLEQALTESRLVEPVDSTYNNNYFNFYPSVFVTRKLGEKSELGFSYSKRVSRPSTYQLNPAKRYSDELNIRTGNPTLNPEFTNSLEISYNKYWKGGSFSTAVFYRHTTDKIQRIKLVDDQGVSTSTYGNIATAQEIGYEASVMTKITEWWSINGSLNMYYTQLDTDDPNFSNNGINWFTRLNNTFNLTKTWSLQASGRYMGKRVIPQGHIDPMYGMELGLRKSLFNKRATLGFRLSDVFNSYQFNYYTSGEGFEEVGHRQWESRVAYVTFTYNFGQAQKKRSKSKRSTEREGGDGDASF